MNPDIPHHRVNAKNEPRRHNEHDEEIVGQDNRICRMNRIKKPSLKLHPVDPADPVILSNFPIVVEQIITV
jgi:hypothetical protein